MKLTLLLIMFGMVSVSWSQPKSFVKNTKPDFKKKSNPTSKSKDAKNAPKIQVVEKVKYSNGKNKS